MIIQKFFFTEGIKPFSDYRSNFFTEGRERPACVDRGDAFQPPCLTPKFKIINSKFETGKVSREDRRLRDRRSQIRSCFLKGRDLCPQRSTQMSGRFFTEVHRRPTKRFLIRDSRSMINNPRSPSPSSFASIRGSIISLKASAPLGRNALTY
jgi:hypothetical protein